MCKSVEEAADTQYSYVVLTTKCIPELSKTSQILQPLFSPTYMGKFSQPIYVLMQNGLNVEVDLYNALEANGIDKPKILTAAVWTGTNLLAPNVVQHNYFVSKLTTLFIEASLTKNIGSSDTWSIPTHGLHNGSEYA